MQYQLLYYLCNWVINVPLLYWGIHFKSSSQTNSLFKQPSQYTSMLGYILLFKCSPQMADIYDCLLLFWQLQDSAMSTLS